jgi:hypothetical protein
MKKFWAFAVLSLLLSSCFKDDEKVPPHQAGNVRTDTIGMSSDYKYQIYYDLTSGKEAGTNLKTDWNIGFECSPNGWHIILNTCNFMMAGDAGIRPVGNQLDTTGLSWKFDPSSGNPDSTAIGKWISFNGNDTSYNQHLYAINLGMDELGNNLGVYQVMFDSLKRNTYYFRFTPKGGGSVTQASVIKDSTLSYVYFTFKFGGKTKKLEPPKENWDLLFTQYTTLLFTDAGIPYPYLVTGVLLNRYSTAVASVDTTISFSTFSFADAQHLNYSTKLDAIGYEWKRYSFSAGSYTVNSNRTYIIRNRLGLYYKLRFISFYNSLGQKGYPVFEYQQL